MLPWPNEFLASKGWVRTRRLLDRLLGAARRGALPGTLMFLGEAGLGREAVAVELAAALICQKAGPACCPCGSCDRVRRGVHPDLEVIDVLPGKSEVSIDDQIRPLIAGLDQRPFEGRHRVFIFASCHNPPLNVYSGSALLKTVEEPPPHVVLMLLATDPARVLPTLVSRSVMVRVPWPREEELVGLLSALHGTSPDEARALLAAGVDATTALQATGENVAGQQQALVDLLSQTLAGDTLALLRLASTNRQDPVTVSMALTAALGVARGSPPERAESALDAAAAIVVAARKHAILHVDLEGAVVAGLAPLVATARRVI